MAKRILVCDDEAHILYAVSFKLSTAGYEVIQAANVPIIMLTAKALELEEHDIEKQFGIKNVIMKPFSPRQLLKVVESLLQTTAKLPAIAS